MRTNLIAAIVTAGTLFGLQSAALAQGASGLSFTPNTAGVVSGQTSVQPYWQGRLRTTPLYYDYYVAPRSNAPGTPRAGQ
jgi:hypothetical protein